MTVQEQIKEAIKLIESRLDAALEESGEYPSDLLMAREALQLQLRMSEFNVNADIRVISPEAFEALPSQDKKDVAAFTADIKALKPYIAKRKMYSMIDYFYNLGLATGLNGDVVCEDECVPVKRADDFYIQCPDCGCQFDINLRGMIDKKPDRYGVGLTQEG